jgi:hypothetical protein
MLTGERSIAEEDRALQLVTDLARAGVGPTMIRRLTGGLVGMPQISYRYRLVALDMVARGRDSAGSRPGAPPGLSYILRLPKDRASVLARVLYLIHETGEAGFRKQGRGPAGWGSNLIRVELLLSAWAVLQHMASSGPARLRESAADISFELLERAEHFVFREQAIGLALCPQCGAVNLRRNTSFVLCCQCNRRIKGMLNLPVQEAEPRRALADAA